MERMWLFRRCLIDKYYLKYYEMILVLAFSLSSNIEEDFGALLYS